MNSTLIIGIVLTVIGILILIVSQLLLRKWIKKYNDDWLGGTDKNEVS